MNEKFKELLKLVEENPDLPILCMVDGDVVGEDYGYWMASIGTATVGEFASYNERYYDDRQAFIEEYYARNDEAIDKYFGYSPKLAEYDAVRKTYILPEKTEEEKEAERRVDAYLEKIADRAFTKAIIVYVETPDDRILEFMDEKEIVD